MELSDYIRILRKFWVSISVTTLLGVMSAALISLLTTPTYTASASLFLTVESGGSAGELAQGSAYTERQVKSFAEIAHAPIVLQPVVDALGLGVTPAQLAGRVTVSVPANTSILDISVVDADPDRAAATAEAIGDGLVRTVADLAPKGESGDPSVEANVITPATVPASATSPKVVQNLLLGFLVGLMLGIGQALLRTALDRKVRNLDDIARLTDVPLIGAVVFDRDAENNQLPQLTAPASARAEEYRRLRTNLQFVGVDGRDRSIAFTSSIAGEGKTSTVLNVALALAEAGKRVLLVDADLRRPRIAKRLNLEGAVGLSTVLLGQASLDDVLQSVGGLDVLPAGQIPPNPSEILGSNAMRSLVRKALDSYEYVLLDSAPLGPVTDTAVLSSSLGGVVLVVGSGDVDAAQLEYALASVEAVDGRVLGMVLNKLKGEDAGHRQNYYYSEGGGARMDPNPSASSGVIHPREAKRAVEAS